MDPDFDDSPLITKYDLYHRRGDAADYEDGDRLVRVFAGQMPDLGAEPSQDADDVRDLMLNGASALNWQGRDGSHGPDPRVFAYLEHNRPVQVGDVVKLEREEEGTVFFALTGDLERSARPTGVAPITAPRQDRYLTASCPESRYLPD